jgi:hypothetical protein
VSYFNTLFWAEPTTNLFWGSGTSLFWQTGTWTGSPIGSGTTGSFSYSAGTYTVAGDGSGVAGTSDSLYFVNQMATGNFEIIAEITSQTNTNAYAIAGLMISDSAAPGGSNQCALIGVSPLNGVNFTARITDGQSATTTLGPSLSVLPSIWLRLVVSQTSVAGYQSPDGIAWQLVGTATMNLPTAFYAGFAVSSNVAGTVSTATFTSVYQLFNVPQRVLVNSVIPSWTQTAIGGSTGSFTVNGDNSYTVSGSGTGINPGYPIDDVLYFASIPMSGPVEFTAEVAALSDSNAGAFGGLMLSDLSTIYPTAAQSAAVGVTTGKGIEFAYRPTDNAPSPFPFWLFPISGTAPTWFRIGVSVSLGTITFCQSVDGANWITVGGAAMTLPSTYFIGVAAWSQYSNTDPDTVNSVTINSFYTTQNANMLSWLRSDVSVIYSGTSISGWSDQSPNGVSGSQSISSNRPSLATNTINGLPAVGFNGTSSFLNLPSLSVSFSAGLTIFVILNLSAITSGQIFNLGTASSNTCRVGLEINSSSQLEYFVYDTTGTILTAAICGSTVSTGAQLIEVVHNGTNCTILINGQVAASNGAMNFISTPSAGWTNNYIGQATAGGSYLNGQIAEVLLYQRAISSYERQNIESYFISKFAL